MAPGGPDGCGARWTAQAARPGSISREDEHDAVQDKLAGPAAARTATGLVRRSLDRRRLSGWDAEWLANGPRWSPRR